MFNKSLICDPAAPIDTSALYSLQSCLVVQELMRSLRIRMTAETAGVWQGKNLIHCLLLAALACSRAPFGEVTDAERAKARTIVEYGDRVNASSSSLLAFSDSLWRRPEQPRAIHDCLNLFDDSRTAHDEFLNCLAIQGQFSFSKHFIEQLIPMRLKRLQEIHGTNSEEVRKSLTLLNWIFDLALEQYQLTDPSSYWLDKKPDGSWEFSQDNRKEKDEFNFQEGDVGINVSPQLFSVLIPQYTYPSRPVKLTCGFLGANMTTRKRT